MKYAILVSSVILSGLSLSGCNYFSARVRSIGMERTEVSGHIKNNKVNAIIDVCESDIYDPSDGFINIWWYKTNYPTVIDHGPAAISYIEPKCEDIKIGDHFSIGVIRNNNIYNFNMVKAKSYDQSEIYFANDYESRNWYGYPAQIFLAASIPLDVGLDVIVFTGSLIAAPFRQSGKY